MDDDRFRMQAFPVNAFSDTPTARLQQVSAAVQAGWLSQQRAEQLLEIMPDFKEQISLDTASLQRVRKMLDDIKYDGKYAQPDIYLNLQEAIVIAQGTLNRAITQSVEEDKLQLIRNFINDCQELQGLGEQPAPEAPPADPMAVPEALPTSELLPMTPPN